MVVLYAWHFRFAFQGALENPFVHLLQHWSFFVTSLLVWWAVVDPKRRRLGGELWKAGHIIGMRVAGMFLGMAFILMRTQAYPWYGDRAQQHGLDPIRDQQYGGGIMFLARPARDVLRARLLLLARGGRQRPARGRAIRGRGGVVVVRRVRRCSLPRCCRRLRRWLGRRRPEPAPPEAAPRRARP